MRQSNQQSVISAVTNDGSTPIYSKAIQCEYLICATAQATFTSGSTAGTLKLQWSNDSANVAPSNWNDIPSTSVSVTAGGTAGTLPTAAPFCYNWLRVAFLPSAGSGTVSANLQTFGM